MKPIILSVSILGLACLACDGEGESKERERTGAQRGDASGTEQTGGEGTVTEPAPGPAPAPAPAPATGTMDDEVDDDVDGADPVPPATPLDFGITYPSYAYRATATEAVSTGVRVTVGDDTITATDTAVNFEYSIVERDTVAATGVTSVIGTRTGHVNYVRANRATVEAAGVVYNPGLIYVTAIDGTYGANGPVTCTYSKPTPLMAFPGSAARYAGLIAMPVVMESDLTCGFMNNGQMVSFTSHLTCNATAVAAGTVTTVNVDCPGTSTHSVFNHVNGSEKAAFAVDTVKKHITSASYKRRGRTDLDVHLLCKKTAGTVVENFDCDP